MIEMGLGFDIWDSNKYSPHTHQINSLPRADISLSLSLFLPQIPEEKREKEQETSMEVESVEAQPQQQQVEKDGDHQHMSRSLRKTLMAVNFSIMVIGNCGAPLLSRLYFIHGGKRLWLSSWLETGGWPVMLIPLSISYLYRRCNNAAKPKVFFITLRLLVASIVLGVLTGLDDYIYAYGLSYLPVSTSALLISTQLGFTAFFAFLIVKQRFTSFSINAVILLSFGAVILGLHANSDRPEGESKGLYYLGFFLTLAAALLYGIVLPLVELTYAKARQAITYTLVMEMQLVMSFSATAFCTVGMLINKDFQAIPREAREFGLGEVTYYLVLIWSAILWQFFFLGTVGAIFYGSSLLAGIIIAVLIPVTEVLAVVSFNEKFTGGKGLALALSLWGFVSYFYGELREIKKKKEKEKAKVESPPETSLPDLKLEST